MVMSGSSGILPMLTVNVPVTLIVSRFRIASDPEAVARIRGALNAEFCGGQRVSLDSETSPETSRAARKFKTL